MFENVDIRPFSTRKQIFSQYKLPDDPVKIQQRLEISKDKKSSNQILLKQLGLFKFNLSSVLTQKNDLLHKLSLFDNKIQRVYNFIAEYNEGDFTDSEQIERKFKSIENVKRQSEVMQNVRSSIRKSKVQRQRVEQSQYLMRALIIYKSLLNEGQQLKFDCQTFRLGTLSNFNPKYTQVKFTKTPQQSQNAVIRYITRIIDQSSKAMESKVRYQNNYEKYRFLLEEDKYGSCWKALEELYSPKQVEGVNFQMLNVLAAFDVEFGRFKAVLVSHWDNCKKYHGVLDSMDLMVRQTQQMAHTIASRDQIIQTLSKLSSSNPSQMQRLLSKCQSQQPLIHNNLRIYHINSKLFATYNTQTNLQIYSKQRNTYSIQLNQLQRRLAKWNGQYESIKEIVQGWVFVDDIVEKKNVVSKRMGLSGDSGEVDRRMMVIEGVDTRRNRMIAGMKANVLEGLKLKILNPDSKSNVISPRTVPPDYQSFSSDQILQTQNSFFSTLQRTPAPQRKPFLLQNSQKIKQYIQYNRRKSEDNTISSSLRERLKAFGARFDVLGQIVRMCKQLQARQTAREQLVEVEGGLAFGSIIKEHLRTIQKQLSGPQFKNKRLVDQLIYQHIHDYSLLSHCLTTHPWLHLTTTLHHLSTSSFISRPVSSSTSHDNIKALKQLISFTRQFIKDKYTELTVNMLQIYSGTLLQLTNGVSMELYNFESQYWGKMVGAVTIFYERKNYRFEQSAYNSKTIDKSSFFTLPYLIHLNRASNKYKVLNLDTILTKIVKMIYDQFTNYRQYEIFQNAVCLTYLMKYIRNVCEREEVMEKVGVLGKLRRLLTGQLLKGQFVRCYEMEKKQLLGISNKMIGMVLGLHGYVAFTNSMAPKRQKLTEFEIENNKYLKGIQQDIKPLVINLSAYTSDLSLQRMKLIWGFEQWPQNISKVLDDSEQLSSILMFSCFSIQRQNLQSLVKLVELIEWSSIKESDGFLIRMIRKENFYLKRQLNKFKALLKENIWKEVDQLFENLLQQLQSSDSLRTTMRAQAQSKIRSIQLKMKQTLATIAQTYK